MMKRRKFVCENPACKGKRFRTEMGLRIHQYRSKNHSTDEAEVREQASAPLRKKKKVQELDAVSKILKLYDGLSFEGKRWVVHQLKF